MKSIVLASIATLAMAGAAVAQEASTGVNWTDSRVELNTNFDGDNSIAARTGVQLWLSLIHI